MTFDALITQYLPADFLDWINQLWALFPFGVLLGVAAWVVSIMVYAAFWFFKKV